MEGEEQEVVVTYVICVVALDRSTLPKRTFKNYYMGVAGSREQASMMQDQIAKTGFKSEGVRVFPDDIESINLKTQDQVDD